MTRGVSQRLAEELKAKIAAGVYPVGAALPAYRQIAKTHGVAINSAIAAVRMLTEQGYLINKPNAGSYVRDRTDTTDTQHALRVLTADLEQLRTQLQQALTAADHTLAGIAERLHALTSATGTEDG